MSATMTKLDRKTWATKLRDYMLAKATKKEADAASRGADSTIRAIRGELREAMGDSPVAICGQAVLTLKSTSPAEATITLCTGEKIAWAKVTGILIGNENIPAARVASLYGGRGGSEDVEISGTP